MPIDYPSAAHHPVRTSRPLGWAGVLLVSVLLHIALLDWANGNIGLPSLPIRQEPVVTAQLQAAPIVPEPAAAPAKPVAAPQPKRRPRPVARPLPAIASTAPPLQTSPSIPDAAPETGALSGAHADRIADAAPAVPPLEPPIEQAAAEAPAASAEPAELRYKVSPPPSAELKYDVQALREGRTVYGRGKLSWQADGDHYVASGEAGILFFTVLNFKSEGALDEFGVAPVMYSEKRFRKSETNTHFHRERNTISFSASTASYPRKGGEQDRASIIWQLVGIGRGDTEKFLPGAVIDIFVAGVRDAESWRIQVIGQEEVTVGTGTTQAWHVARVPRPGSYDQKLDIWLAPQQEWYPVKLRYTETNGDYLDMLLSNVNLAAAR